MSQCPRCNSGMSRVLETRKLRPNGIHMIIRVRKCEHCGKQFRTKEITDQTLSLSRKQKQPPSDPLPPADPPPLVDPDSPPNPFF